MRTPIKATAREPIEQAGYIPATSDTLRQLTCERQPVHTFGSDSGSSRSPFARPLTADHRTFGGRLSGFGVNAVGPNLLAFVELAAIIAVVAGIAATVITASD